MKHLNQVIPNKKFKDPSPTKLREFGLKTDNLKIVEKIEELKKSPPNLVIAKCIRNVEFTQNFSKKQHLKKNENYVMGLGIYKQLWFDTISNNTILKPSNTKFKCLYKPYTGQDLTDKKILITRTGGIGDLLFILPNLTFLKERYPTCKICFACGPQYQSMVETWNEVDELVNQPFELQFFKECDYHAVFEGVIERSLEAIYTNAYHLFTRWLGLNLPDEKLIPKQKPKEEMVKICKEYLDNKKLNNGFILIQLRASSAIRTPRPEFWKKIIESLTDNGHDVIITDSPTMSDTIDNFIKELKPTTQEKVKNFSKNSITLDYSIALTSLAKCVIAPDSSLIHLAASLSVPGLGIYGAFPGKIRLSTYKNIDWVEAKKPNCGGPCFLHGYMPCKHSINNHPRCYDEIDIKVAIDKIENLLKKDSIKND